MTLAKRAAAATMAAILAAGPTVSLAQATSGAPRAAVQSRASLAEPSLSADGTQIAFVSGGDIWEVAASGGVAHLLVTDAATEGRPCIRRTVGSWPLPRRGAAMPMSMCWI